MPVLDELSAYLAAAGHGTRGTDLFEGVLPDTPDTLLALFEAPGGPPVHTMSGGAGSAILQRPAVQLLGRAGRQDYDAARLKVAAAANALDGLANVDLGGVRYVSIFKLNEPHLVERDATERVVIGCDLQIEKVPS